MQWMLSAFPPALLLTALMFLPTGCESNGSSGDTGGETATCSDGDAMCTEDGMIAHCADGEYGEPEACPEDQYCMTMPDTGVTHCMLMEESGMDAMETMDDGMETMDDGMETMDDGMETMDDGMETMDEEGETGDEG